MLSSLCTLTGTTNLGENGPGNNHNEGALHTPQKSRTGSLRPDTA